MRSRARTLACLGSVWLTSSLCFGASIPQPAPVRVSAPLACNKGPDNQRFEAAVSMASTAIQGSTLTIRIDGVSSGKISQFGLNHLRDATSDYVVPTGTTYLAGSARLVPDTGTDNVSRTARVAFEGGVVRLTLPGHVSNNSSYTPPSFEFQAVVIGAPGDALVLGFSQFRIVANAFVVGDVRVDCTPKPRPFALATARVIAAP